MSFRTFVHRDVSRVVVTNFGAGSISIEHGPQDDAVEGSLNAADQELLEGAEISQDGHELRIALPHRLFLSSTAHLRLGVPDGLSYSIDARSADIRIAAVMRRSKVVSGSGDITIDDAEDLICSTGSGELALGQLGGAGARLNTGSGDISVTTAHCPISVRSGSGDVVVRSVRQSALQASSGSGDITVPSTTGSVDLRSASGSLTVGVADELPAWLDLSSVTGSIRIALETGSEPSPGEPYVSIRARTASGEIAVYRA
ncbi:MAG TPA: DUF4097 family beta strand repeat-containing protein [Propionibacteriaceae bacterium]|nr:DUF4097 family beta strand repeat-containing protein [Propionibacteriaceae bacterium]